MVRTLVVALLLAYSISGQQTCPECYNNQQHIPGHGTSADGRTKVNVWIETPQGSPEYAKINGGVGGAANSWNLATDGSGNKTHYYFDQTTDQTQADFAVTIGNPVGGCAQIDMTVYPHVITVSAALLQQSPEEIEAAFKHEFGHRLGDAEASNTPTCGTSNSIMRGQVNCVFWMHAITADDVAQARRAYSNPNSCTRVSPTTAITPADRDAIIRKKKSVIITADHGTSTAVVAHIHRPLLARIMAVTKDPICFRLTIARIQLVVLIHGLQPDHAAIMSIVQLSSISMDQDSILRVRPKGCGLIFPDEACR